MPQGAIGENRHRLSKMRGVASQRSKRSRSVPRSGAGRILRALALGTLSVPSPIFAQQADVTLPEVKVIGTTPLSSVSTPRRSSAREDSQPTVRRAAPATGRPAAAPAPAPVPVVEPVATDPGLIDRFKVPSNTVTLTPSDFDHAKSTSVPDALLQRVPSVSINDTAGNPFQPDVQYRGFTASPTLGTPQGLAIYQNGVRVNEVFGDTVNWDFIPESAIHRLDVLPSNPIFGLNALGGAISIEMKNGFSYQGSEAEVRGGSYWRRAAQAQVGMRQGDVSFYAFTDAINDNGWRDRSPSELRRVYADIGMLGDRSEFHVNFTGASNKFGATATTPVQMLNERWSAVYTTPQTYKNQLAFLNATQSYRATDTLTFKSNVYYRGFWQKHDDGNTSDAGPCDADSFPGFLCFNNNLLFGLNGQPVPDILNGALAGSVDRTATAANAYGGSAQAANATQLFGHNNQFIIGASIDRGRVNFQAASELGTIGSDLFVTGTGVIVNQPDGSVAPVNLNTGSTYYGFYVTDTLDLTSQLSVTAGGRFNLAQIKLDDQLGTALNGIHEFNRFNPVVGATYKITQQLGAYAGYSEANRAPTPVELACSDPVRPCLLDNFLVADPSLKQVVARTYEAGLRGNIDAGPKNGRFAWNLGIFHTTSQDDIIQVASPIPGRGFFQNAGTTRRRGVEASAEYQSERWKIYSSYSYIDATFQDVFTLLSVNNPRAINGLITVTPGNVIPSIPAHRVKAGFDYAVFDNWKVGADLIGVSGQYLRGDESNLNPMLPGYWVLNLHTTYQVSKQVELFALVQNLTDQRYYTFGTFFATNDIPFLNFTDPRTLSPSAPRTVSVGLRGKLGGETILDKGPTADKAPIYKSPVVSAWNWAGFYLGGNIGYGAGHSNTDAELSTNGSLLRAAKNAADINGFVGGGQAGFNWQSGIWVAGIEADFQRSRRRTGTTTFECASAICNPAMGEFNINAPVQASLKHRLEWAATLRGRLGVTPTPESLVYATGGLALGRITTSGTVTGFGLTRTEAFVQGFEDSTTTVIDDDGNEVEVPVQIPTQIPVVIGSANPVSTSFADSRIKAGWTVGLGMEARLGGNWTGRVEYLYMDFGSVSTSATLLQNSTPLAITFNSRITDNVFRVGLNYKFD
jgi:iron complex outermembrane recepter protein